ncbi:MAG: hypothetical protein WCG28_02375 [bacterium]
MKKNIVAAFLLAITSLLTTPSVIGANMNTPVDIVSPSGGENFSSQYDHGPGDTISVRWNSSAAVSNIWVCLQTYDDAFEHWSAGEIISAYLPTDTGTCELELDWSVSAYFASDNCVIGIYYTLGGEERCTVSKQFKLNTPQANIKFKGGLDTRTVSKTIPCNIIWECVAGNTAPDGYYAYILHNGTYTELTSWDSPTTTNTLTFKTSGLDEGVQRLYVEAVASNRVIGVSSLFIKVVADADVIPTVAVSRETNTVTIVVNGQTDRHYDVESSTDMVHWAKINNQPLLGGYPMTRPKLVAKNEYYRAVLVR